MFFNRLLLHSALYSLDAVFCLFVGRGEVKGHCVSRISGFQGAFDAHLIWK